jgi:hypothetical protein
VSFYWIKFSVTHCCWYIWNNVWWVICQRTPENSTYK